MEPSDELVELAMAENANTADLLAFLRQAFDAGLIVPADEHERHRAYVDPVNGGWAGYQAACWDCDWRGTDSESKDRAHDEADTHCR